MYRQIYEAIRAEILSGEFASNMRLPSTRSLAQTLGVSRITVFNAYEQLLAEGYLEGKTGAGTFVASRLPDDLLQTAEIESEKKRLKNLRRSIFAVRRKTGFKRGRIRPNADRIQVSAFSKRSDGS